MTIAEAVCRPLSTLSYGTRTRHDLSPPSGHADKVDNALPNMHPASETRTAIEFGRFSVWPHRRELVAEGWPMKLGERAFDVLMALIEARGAVVGKDALMKRVWPGRIVEENSLHMQISALRKTLASDRDLIRTIAGRGYQFIGVIRTVSTNTGAVPTATTTVPLPDLVRVPTNLPELVSKLIDRDVELDEILGLAASHRLVTLTGAGGIGKTRLGVEVARHLLPRFADGVWIAELAPLSDPGVVPVTVAKALGIEVAGSGASMERVVKALCPMQFMLVLDNCEHVVDAVAQMAEALLRANPAARVITTSRDPLRVEGERIYRVPPLAVPTESGSDSETLLRYGAIRLFVERVRAAEPRFSPDECVVAAICRRLDGNPLAIELAAARAATVGVEEIASRLDDRFDLLSGGNRTALPRQRTLRASFDWSYGLLPEIEKLVLRRLSVFAGGFTLQAAGRVATSAELSWTDIVDCVANLVGKSLITANVRASEVHYRLSETTRVYALEKLSESGESRDVARRHAECHRSLLPRATAESETQPTSESTLNPGLPVGVRYQPSHPLGGAARVTASRSAVENSQQWRHEPSVRLALPTSLSRRDHQSNCLAL